MGGACQSNNTMVQDLQALPTQQNVQKNPPRVSSNPFYEFDVNQNNELSNFYFRSRYKDEFIGDCSLIQEYGTGDLYLWKELQFENQIHIQKKAQQLQTVKKQLTSENVIRIKEVILKDTAGFFGKTKKLYIIIDYPLISFQKQIADRISRNTPFTKQEIINFLNSTIKGYAAIEQAKLKTDKIRLKNIFVGIKNKNPIIKVAQNSLLQPKSNIQYIMNDGGPYNIRNRDIYLSPEQYQAWVENNLAFSEKNNFNKSGVFSLGMCLLDLCIMEPSREIYHFTQKKMDFPQIKHRIEIVGRKYDENVQALLREMLQEDPLKRISFIQLQKKLPNLAKNENIAPSRMHLSVISNAKSQFIINGQQKAKSSEMFKSVVSNNNLNISKQNSSRQFKSRIKMDQSRIKQQEILKITEHYTNGNKYYGQKKGPYKHGKGRYDHADGSFYDGEWYENKINGRGILYFKDGKNIQYDGEWRNDLYNGWGTLFSQTSNWSRYEGEFKNGVKQGRGRMYFRDGSIYDGEFRGDKISGRGRKVSTNGQVLQKYWDTASPESIF